MTVIPDTNTQAIFQTVAAGAHPNLYYQHGECGPALASMNAGNSGALYLGGGGINAAFAAALAGHNSTAYADRHQALVAQAGEGRDLFTHYSNTDLPLLATYLCGTKITDADDYTGIAFANVFTERGSPNQNSANRAMLYVAPPDGRHYRNAEVFLADVSTTATHAVASLHGYNDAADKTDLGLPIIEALRLCVYSSGIYRMSGVTADQVAVAIYHGVITALQQPNNRLRELQMPVSDDAQTPYFAAIKRQLDET